MKEKPILFNTEAGILMDRSFRGKGINTNEWVYGGYYKHLKRTPCPIGDSIKERDCQHLILTSGFSDWNMPREVEFSEVKKETIGQYTGFKDKNNKRIYEGDIVVIDNHKFVIIYEIGSFMLSRISKETDMQWQFEDCWNDNVYPLSQLYWEYDCEEDIIDEIEVIGNISENPELLREK